MTNEIIIIIFGILLVLIAGILIFWLWQKNQSHQKVDKLKLEIGNEFRKLSQEMITQAHQQLLSLAEEKLGAEKKEIRTDLANKRDQISQMIEEIRQRLMENEKKLLQTEGERIKSFSSLKSILEEHQQITRELKNSTENLKKILSNNQLRGQFGEQVAENLLKMAGFVVKQDYIVNQSQESINTRPDFIVFLPDKTKINIDVKFPYAALKKYAETEDKNEKEKFFHQFSTDVKQKIKQVTNREYINPQDKTVDFVILFIPNEMIFSFIYEKMNDIWEDAVRRKVVLAGPFSFTAILRMIKQSYTNFQYQKNLGQVIALIQNFKQEFNKFNESFDVLGKRLKSSLEQYEKVSQTRTRQLQRVIDKIESTHNLDKLEQ